MLRPWLFVGFSGHRELANPELVAQRIRDALRQLAERTGAPLAAVSSAAKGADTIFAEIAVEQGLPWTLLLPFPIEEFRKDFSKPEEQADWQRVECLLPRALRTVIESPVGQRPEAYNDCGIRTVDESDVLLVVWNGQNRADKRGGTGDIVEYARRVQKPMVWIDSVTGATKEERCEKLPASNQSTPPSGRIGEGSALLKATFDHFNSKAKRHRPWAINLNLSLVVLHQLAIITAIAALIWTAEHWITEPASWIKVTFLLVALALPWFLGHTHEDWMNNRIRAEMCRSATAIWPLQQAEEIFPALRLPVYEDLQRSLLLLRLLSPPAGTDLEGARRAYETDRVKGQLNYYREHAGTAARQRFRLKWASRCFTAAAIVAGLLVARHVVAETTSTYRWIKFVSVTLPLVAAALLAAIAALDTERRSARYREMAAFLERAQARIQHTSTWTGLRRIVAEVERTLLLEIWEWYSVARFSTKQH
jgi:hypothetical protein